MRALAGLVMVALLSAPLAFAAPVCTPYVLARACVSVTAGTAVDGDVYVVTPIDWRSAHASAGLNGAGAGLHGYGFATNGPFDVWAGASPAGPHAGAYFCLGAPTLPSSCGDLLYHVMRLASLVP